MVTHADLNSDPNFAKVAQLCISDCVWLLGQLLCIWSLCIILSFVAVVSAGHCAPRGAPCATAFISVVSCVVAWSRCRSSCLLGPNHWDVVFGRHVIMFHVHMLASLHVHL